MKSHPFEWSSNPLQHAEKALQANTPMALKALGIVYKHFLVPMSGIDLESWKKNDHFIHHLQELMDEGDDVLIRPWLVGGWVGDRETLFELEPMEYSEESFGSSIWSDLLHWRQHQHGGALFGFYLTVERKKEGWSAVFACLLEEKPKARKLGEIAIKEVVCLSLDGDVEKVDAWLDWAYCEGRVA